MKKPKCTFITNEYIKQYGPPCWDVEYWEVIKDGEDPTQKFQKEEVYYVDKEMVVRKAV